MPLIAWGGLSPPDITELYTLFNCRNTNGFWRVPKVSPSLSGKRRRNLVCLIGAEDDETLQGRNRLRPQCELRGFFKRDLHATRRRSDHLGRGVIQLIRDHREKSSVRY